MGAYINRWGLQWGQRKWDFGTDREEIFVVYVRRSKGKSQFTCIKPYDQFTEENHVMGENIWKYEDLERVNSLGKGAYGTVYKVKDKTTNLWHAEKVLKNMGSSKTLERQSREFELCQRLAKLPHECLVKIQLVAPEHKAIVMELCPTDLENQVAVTKAKGWEEPDRAMKWIWQVYRGLRYLHASRVLHRDLKPSNVLLTQDDCAKLTDFGSTKSDYCAGPHTWGAPPGTKGYDAPEVLKQTPYGSAADLFAFGVLAWFVLTGVQIDPIIETNDWNEIPTILLKAYRDRAESIRSSMIPFPPLTTGTMREFILDLLSESPEDRPKHANIPKQLDKYGNLPKSEEAPADLQPRDT